MDGPNCREINGKEPLKEVDSIFQNPAHGLGEALGGITQNALQEAINKALQQGALQAVATPDGGEQGEDIKLEFSLNDDGSSSMSEQLNKLVEQLGDNNLDLGPSALLLFFDVLLSALSHLMCSVA